jgi:hypothetical protein
MPQQDGFTGGLQFGLSVFNALQNASYLQSQQQAMQENQEMRRQNLALEQRKFEFDKQQDELTRAQFLIQNPSVGSADARLAAFNTVSRYATNGQARPATRLDLEAWEQEDQQIVQRLEGAPDEQARLNILTEMQAKASQHPLRLEQFNLRRPALERIGKERGIAETMRNLYGELFSEEERNRWVKNADPAMLTKLFEDKETGKMVAHNQVERNLAAFQAGERLSPEKLRDTFAMARSIGMELGPKAEELVKLHDTYQMHNETYSRLTSTKQRLAPLFEQIHANAEQLRPIKEFEVVKTSASDFAGVYGENPFSLVKYGANADIAQRQNQLYENFLSKQPQFAQELNTQARAAAERNLMLDVQLQAIEQDIRLVGGDVNAKDRGMKLHLLEQQAEQVKREMNALKPLAAYDGNKNISTLKGVLNMEKSLNKQFLEVRELRETAKTASDRRADQEVTLKQREAASLKATFGMELELNKRLGVNPNADEATVRKWAGEIAPQMQRQFGQLPDSNKALDSVLTKKSHVTQVSIGAEERKQISQGESRLNLVEQIKQDYQDNFVGIADNWWAENVSGPTGMMSEKEARFRANTTTLVTELTHELAGAAQSIPELERLAPRLPDAMKSPAQFKAVLRAYEDLKRGDLEGLINVANQLGMKIPEQSWQKLRRDMKGGKPTATTKQPLGGQAADMTADLKRSKAFKDIKSKHPDVSDDLVLQYLQETGGQ